MTRPKLVPAGDTGGGRWTHFGSSTRTIDKVKTLLSEFESTTERGVKTREGLFATIKRELTVHEIIEEEIFDPELKEAPKAKDIVLEACQEHNVVGTLMGELEACRSTTRRGARRQWS